MLKSHEQDREEEDKVEKDLQAGSGVQKDKTRKPASHGRSSGERKSNVRRPRSTRKRPRNEKRANVIEETNIPSRRNGKISDDKYVTTAEGNKEHVRNMRGRAVAPSKRQKADSGSESVEGGREALNSKRRKKV